MEGKLLGKEGPRRRELPHLNEQDAEARARPLQAGLRLNRFDICLLRFYSFPNPELDGSRCYSV